VPPKELASIPTKQKRKMTIQSALAVASLLVITISPILHAQSAALSAQVTDPSKALQGTWEGEEVGKESKGKSTMTIDGNTLRFEGPGRVEWYSATFTLSPDQTPKQLQATITDCSKSDFVGKSAMSIFKLEDGTLTLVGNRPGVPDAPKDFDGDAASRRFVFKKAQQAK
jgi:uncharacterized protein (TIGR03067 family)